MLKRIPYPLGLLVLAGMLHSAYAQQTRPYLDSLSSFRNNYIQTHEAVKPGDRQFLQFFPIDSNYKITCRFESIQNGKWFQMATSGQSKQTYRRFGKLLFSIHDTLLELFVYQSQSLLVAKDYQDYLFIPFTDETCGKDSYAGGRYLEARFDEIKNHELILDFNKAYNPYCAYSVGYNCPIPPLENNLLISIRAGEKNYRKKSHPR